MEKLGVVTKKAKKCPVCGKETKISASGSVYCPVHGTKPFELGLKNARYNPKPKKG